MNNQTKTQELTAAVVQPEGDLVAPRLPALRSKLQAMLGAGIVHLTLDLACDPDGRLGRYWPVDLGAQLAEESRRRADGNPRIEGYSRSFPDHAHPSALFRFRKLGIRGNHERA